MKAEDFIPKSKMDTDLIERLSKQSYPFYKPILKDLFEWIQDINWPVARAIVPLLVNAGDDVVPIVSEILKSDDDVWKYWTLGHVVSKMGTSIIKKIEPELLRIKNSPTEGEKIEEVNLIAEELLNSSG